MGHPKSNTIVKSCCTSQVNCEKEFRLWVTPTGTNSCNTSPTMKFRARFVPCSSALQLLLWFLINLASRRHLSRSWRQHAWARRRHCAGVEARWMLQTILLNNCWRRCCVRDADCVNCTSSNDPHRFPCATLPSQNSKLAQNAARTKSI